MKAIFKMDTGVRRAWSDTQCEHRANASVTSVEA